MTATAGRRWQGIVREHGELLGLPSDLEPVSLGEGGTPLLEAPVVSSRVGAPVYLKLEGANPTGSFKDRGMTVAVSRARAAGARVVLCASTGNTSASAAAYAARGGLGCGVVLPAGRVARGKLAQALQHGATIVPIDGGFDEALALVRRLADGERAVLVNSVNPDRILGQETAALEVAAELGHPPDLLALPVGNAGNITAYWHGFRRLVEAGRLADGARLPVLLGVQAAGSAPLVVGHEVDEPVTVASAIRIGRPASAERARVAVGESGGRFLAVTDEQILAAYHLLGEKEGVFCEPASAASVAGVLQSGYRGPGPVVCVLTGHGLKDPDTASAERSMPPACPAALDAVAERLGLSSL